MKHLFALTTLAVVGLGLLFVPARGGDKGLDSPYFPLKKGTTWEYVADGKKITTVVTDHEKVGDLLCAKIETDLGGGQKIVEHIAVKDDGIYRVRANNEDVKPPFLMLKLPPKKGEEWTVDSTAKGFGIKGKMTIAADEDRGRRQAARADRRRRREPAPRTRRNIFCPRRRHHAAAPAPIRAASNV